MLVDGANLSEFDFALISVVLGTNAAAADDDADRINRFQSLVAFDLRCFPESIYQIGKPKQSR
jgi:hypothetical protein